MFLITKDEKKSLRIILGSCLLVVLYTYTVNTDASSFLLESEVNARVTFDDNVNTSAIDKESSTLFTITPKMKLNYFSDAWETAMNASISSSTYSSQFQDETNGHLSFETAYKDNRNIYSIATGYDTVSNRAENENVAILGQTITKTFSIAPKYTRLLTERLSLSLDYSYSDVDYNQDSIGRYLPYETQAAMGLMTYKWSQKSELSLILSATDYTSENNISEYQFLASKIGLVHNFSEVIAAQFIVGMSNREFVTRDPQNFTFFGSTVTGAPVETSGSGGLFKALIDAKWVELSISRDVAPNFTGGLDQTDKLHAKFRMQITPIIGITLTLDQVKIDEINDNVLDYSQTYSRVIPALNYSLSRNLSLRAAYILIEQKYVSLSSGTSKSNKFSINLKYNFPSL